MRKISCVVEYVYETEGPAGVFNKTRTEKLYKGTISEMKDQPNFEEVDNLNGKIQNSFQVKIVAEDKFRLLFNSIRRIKIEGTWYKVRQVKNYMPNLVLICEYLA